MLLLHMIACKQCCEDVTSNYRGEEGNCQIHNKEKHNNEYRDDRNWKWTDGKPYERTRRMKFEDQEQYNKKIETSAYSSSLLHDENTWEILNQSLSGSGFKVSNKREELGDKLANREMIQQIGFNPFLGQTDYVDDITIRDQFLKPMNTSQGEKI